MSGSLIRHAQISGSLQDMTTPGVVVEVSAEDAEAVGAFQEAALTEAEAWDANGDLRGAR